MRKRKRQNEGIVACGVAVSQHAPPPFRLIDETLGRQTEETLLLLNEPMQANCTFYILSASQFILTYSQLYLQADRPTLSV